MQFTQLFEDDRAVSPVIGVILMVAITVILAAVIGSFVLGLGNSVQQTSPNANFQFDFNSGTVNATHTGGDTIPESANVTLTNGSGGVDTFSSGAMNAGDSFPNGVSYSEGDQIRVIWTSENGDTSQTLAEQTAPAP